MSNNFESEKAELLGKINEVLIDTNYRCVICGHDHTSLSPGFHNIQVVKEYGNKTEAQGVSMSCNNCGFVYQFSKHYLLQYDRSKNAISKGGRTS